MGATLVKNGLGNVWDTKSEVAPMVVGAINGAFGVGAVLPINSTVSTTISTAT